MIDMQIESRGWQKPGLALALKRATVAALKKAGQPTGTLTLLLTSDAKLRALNHQFRGKNKSTNVLSFPGESEDYLGDIAIAYGVAAAEAKAQGKSLKAHATHLVVHGTLHLLGYDHERSRDAHAMESLEVDILAKLGIADPYRTGKAPRGHV